MGEVETDPPQGRKSTGSFGGAMNIGVAAFYAPKLAEKANAVGFGGAIRPAPKIGVCHRLLTPTVFVYHFFRPPGSQKKSRSHQSIRHHLPIQSVRRRPGGRVGSKEPDWRLRRVPTGRRGLRPGYGGGLRGPRILASGFLGAGLARLCKAFRAAPRFLALRFRRRSGGRTFSFRVGRRSCGCL